MALHLKSSVLRLYIFFINLILGLFGIFLLGLAIYISLNKANTPEVIGSYLFNAGVYVALFCATFLILLPLWGSIALKRYSRLMLILYIAGISILSIVTFCGGISLLVFPAPSAVSAEMNKTLFTEYGKRGFITDAWNFVQSKLRCCAIENNGWGAYRGSWWDLSVNVYNYSTGLQLPETSTFYKRVPESCCLTLLDPLTGWPSDQFQNLFQCQNWQYGPPRFTGGAHNDAIYYRGCLSAMKSYLSGFSKPIGALTFITSLILVITLACSVILLIKLEKMPNYRNGQRKQGKI